MRANADALVDALVDQSQPGWFNAPSVLMLRQQALGLTSEEVLYLLHVFAEMARQQHPQPRLCVHDVAAHSGAPLAHVERWQRRLCVKGYLQLRPSAAWLVDHPTQRHDVTGLLGLLAQEDLADLRRTALRV